MFYFIPPFIPNTLHKVTLACSRGDFVCCLVYLMGVFVTTTLFFWLVLGLVEETKCTTIVFFVAMHIIQNNPIFAYIAPHEYIVFFFPPLKCKELKSPQSGFKSLVVCHIRVDTCPSNNNKSNWHICLHVPLQCT